MVSQAPQSVECACESLLLLPALLTTSPITSLSGSCAPPAEQRSEREHLGRETEKWWEGTSLTKRDTPNTRENCRWFDLYEEPRDMYVRAAPAQLDWITTVFLAGSFWQRGPHVSAYKCCFGWQHHEGECSWTGSHCWSSHQLILQF